MSSASRYQQHCIPGPRVRIRFWRSEKCFGILFSVSGRFHLCQCQSDSFHDFFRIHLSAFGIFFKQNFNGNFLWCKHKRCFTFRNGYNNSRIRMVRSKTATAEPQTLAGKISAQISCPPVSDIQATVTFIDMQPRYSGCHQSTSPQLTQRGNQLWNQFIQISHYSVIGSQKYRRIWILIDGDDGF